MSGRWAMIWVLAAMAAGLLGMGCGSGGSTTAGEEPVEGPSTGAMAAFERTMERQYHQLGLNYEVYDGLRDQTMALEEGPQRRIHRQLMRRHRRLAQLHEEWVGVVRRHGLAGETEHMKKAAMHREAQRWHGRHYRNLDPQAVAEEDAQLRRLRRAIQGEWPRDVAASEHGH